MVGDKNFSQILKLTPWFLRLPNSSQGCQRFRNDWQFKIFYIMEKTNIFMIKWRKNNAKLSPWLLGLSNGSQGCQRFRNDCQFKIFYIIEKKTIFSRLNDAKKTWIWRLDFWDFFTKQLTRNVSSSMESFDTLSSTIKISFGNRFVY